MLYAFAFALLRRESARERKTQTERGESISFVSIFVNCVVCLILCGVDVVNAVCICICICSGERARARGRHRQREERERERERERRMLEYRIVDV
jgi:hypothetical protein